MSADDAAVNPNLVRALQRRCHHLADRVEELENRIDDLEQER